MVYAQPDSLQPVIDKFKLERKTATVQRQPTPGATGALASERLLQSVFGNDAVRNKRNTDAAEVGPNQLASARIVQYTPSRTLALAEVREHVLERLQTQQAAALARRGGMALLVTARQNEAALPTTAIISRANTEGLPRQVMDAVLGADAGKLPQAVGIDLGDQGYVVARVTKVLPREAAPGGDAQFTTQFGQMWTDAEAQLYMASLKRRFRVEIKDSAIAAAAKASTASP